MPFDISKPFDVFGTVFGGGGARRRSYSDILVDDYGASEVYPLVDIASGTAIPARVNTAYNGTLTGWDLQNASGPVAGTLAPLSGAGDYGNIGSLALAFNGAVGSALIYGKMDAALWSDANDYYLCIHQVNANNTYRIYKSGVLGIRVYIAIGGVAKIVTLGVPASPSDWFCVGLSWKDSANGNEVKCFLNGSQGGATQTGFGAWTGTTTSHLVGALSTTPANPWHGLMAYHVFKFGAIWAPTDFSDMYAARLAAGRENP